MVNLLKMMHSKAMLRNPARTVCVPICSSAISRILQQRASLTLPPILQGSKLMTSLLHSPASTRGLTTSRREDFVLAHDFYKKGKNESCLNFSSVSSSSSSSSSSSEPLVELSPTSLNLFPIIHIKIFESLWKFPEILSAFSSETVLEEKIEILKRVNQILKQSVPISEERVAVLMLLAQHLHDFCDMNATDLLEEAASHGSIDDNYSIWIAVVKSLCTQGLELEKANTISKSIVDVTSDYFQDGPVKSLKHGCATNSHALCRLLLNRTWDLNEAAAIKELFNISACTLRNAFHATSETDMMRALALTCASSYGNLGISDLCQNYSIQLKRGGALHMDSAMEAWNNGLSILDEYSLSNKISNRSSKGSYKTKPDIVADLVRARLHCNMAWTILNSLGAKTNEDHLKIASKHAGDALKLYEKILAGDTLVTSMLIPVASAVRPLMARALTLVAMCYARAGSAVTAEGLLQSAISDLSNIHNNNPFSLIDAKNAYIAYADLCRNWEKRSGDAEKYQKLAEEANAKLSEVWRVEGSLSGIYSGLYFYSFGDLSL